MLKIGNFKSTKEALIDYIKAGDFTKPFIVAGWTGIGKSALVKQVADEMHMKDCDYTLVYFNLETPAKEIIEEARKTSDKPKMIEVTHKHIIDGVRDIEQAGYAVHELELDPQEWLEWAQQINPETGRCNVDKRFVDMLKAKPEMIHQGFETQKKVREVIDNLTNDVINYDGTDFDELYKLINKLYINLGNVELCFERAEKVWEPVIESLKTKMAQLVHKDQARLLNVVMQLGEANSKMYY